MQEEIHNKIMEMAVKEAQELMELVLEETQAEQEFLEEELLLAVSLVWDCLEVLEH